MIELKHIVNRIEMNDEEDSNHLKVGQRYVLGVKGMVGKSTFFFAKAIRFPVIQGRKVGKSTFSCQGNNTLSCNTK